MNNQYYKYEITNSFPDSLFIKGDQFIIFVKENYTGIIIESIQRKSLFFGFPVNTLTNFWVNNHRELISNSKEIKRLDKLRLLMGI